MDSTHLLISDPIDCLRLGSIAPNGLHEVGMILLETEQKSKRANNATRLVQVFNILPGTRLLCMAKIVEEIVGRNGSMLRYSATSAQTPPMQLMARLTATAAAAAVADRR